MPYCDYSGNTKELRLVDEMGENSLWECPTCGTLYEMLPDGTIEELEHMI